MKYIPLKSNRVPGLKAVVDDEDYPELNRFIWTPLYQAASNTFRATRNTRVKGKSRVIYMHRVIMNAPTGMDVDHINHNTLDNRKLNLRVCTRRQNMMNKRCSRKSTSSFKGVSFYSATGRYLAQIRVNGKNKNIGYYKSEIDAARAYDAYAKEVFGQFACLNFNS